LYKRSRFFFSVVGLVVLTPDFFLPIAGGRFEEGNVEGRILREKAKMARRRWIEMLLGNNGQMCVCISVGLSVA